MLKYQDEYLKITLIAHITQMDKPRLRYGSYCVSSKAIKGANEETTHFLLFWIQHFELDDRIYPWLLEDEPCNLLSLYHNVPGYICKHALKHISTTDTPHSILIHSSQLSFNHDTI